jgi:hypothetical protein
MKQTKPVIRRYFSDHVFQPIKNDFAFLIDKIKQSGFELDLELRDNYFNLYCRGNSLGKVSYSTKTGLYAVSVHKKFVGDDVRKRFKHQERGEYLTFHLPSRDLHPFFSSKNLTSMGQKVKAVNYQEEIAFEQMLMTDNVGRTDLIIIDRQVRDTASSTKMDLLALSRKKGNEFNFCVIEVKLGNNRELEGAVLTQLQGYIERIASNHDAYKRCYELNISQKQALELLPAALSIDIVPGVIGLIVVGGYSGIADKKVRALVGRNPSIKVLHLKNVIHLSAAK